jgi:hypothetical protein
MQGSEPAVVLRLLLCAVLQENGHCRGLAQGGGQVERRLAQLGGGESRKISDNAEAWEKGPLNMVETSAWEKRHRGSVIASSQVKGRLTQL